MPTSATVQLENLLERGVRDSLKNPLVNGDGAKDDPDPNQRTGSGCARHLYISPATPEQAAIPPEYSSSDPLSPSPYVANHKRRRGGDETTPGEAADSNDGGGFGTEEVVVGDNFVNENLIANDDDDDDDFSAGRQIDSSSIVSAQGDFFDADDDFSSDGSISNGTSRIESEIHATRLSTLEEIERRRTAEETLSLMRSQWARLIDIDLMSQAGLTFPSPQVDAVIQLDDSSIGQFCQQVVVARFVNEAIGRGLARAEAEEAAAVTIEVKDQEISRLQDRLQYYETVNHELSQRKLLEVARSQQKKKMSRRRWLWSFAGFSIAVGATFVAYSYIPHASEYWPSLESGDLSDSSCVSPSDNNTSS